MKKLRLLLTLPVLVLMISCSSEDEEQRIRSTCALRNAGQLTATEAIEKLDKQNLPEQGFEIDEFCESYIN